MTKLKKSQINNTIINVQSSSPTSGDDASLGYDVGSQWFNSSTEKLYFCTDATISSAVWVELPVGGGAVESITGYYVNNTDPANPVITAPRANVAGSNPASGNDNTQGYAVGSIWFNSTSDVLYICTDASTGAAVWETLAMGGSGTVTSVGLSVPTGLSVSGSPVTSSGTLAITLTAGYVIPLQSTLDTFATLTGTQTLTNKIVRTRNDIQANTATITPDFNNHNYIERTAQTSNLTINAPTNMEIGDILTIVITGGDSGSITMNGAYVFWDSNPAPETFENSETIEFIVHRTTAGYLTTAIS